MHSRCSRVVTLSVPIALVAVLSAGCLPFGQPASPKATKADETVQPATDVPFAVGDLVAAVWDDGNFYLANVMGIKGDAVTVKYVDDQSTKTISPDQIVTIEKRTWAVGDRVLAVWALGRFYSGTVEKAAPDGYTIKWADGSTPSVVTPDKIISVR